MIYLLKKEAQAPRFKVSEDKRTWGRLQMLSSDFTALVFLLGLGSIVELWGLWIQHSVHFEWSAQSCFSMSLFAEGNIFRMYRCCYSRSACTQITKPGGRMWQVPQERVLEYRDKGRIFFSCTVTSPGYATKLLHRRESAPPWGTYRLGAGSFSIPGGVSSTQYLHWLRLSSGYR